MTRKPEVSRAMAHRLLMLVSPGLTTGLLVVGGIRAELYLRAQWGPPGLVRSWLGRTWARVLAAARKISTIRSGRLNWQRYLLICATLTAAVFFSVAFHHIYFDRAGLPDIGPFVRFEFSTIGTVYDANGQPLIEIARERRRITRYQDIPSVVREAIIAVEDKNFFSHSGVDYFKIPRVLAKVRIGALLARVTGWGRQVDSAAIFPQGGSTITQQLVRGYFLKILTDRESSNEVRQDGWLSRAMSYAIGRQSAAMLVRKLEEIRLSLWIEKELQERFGSKRRAKEEILARYASFIYMGRGQYGFATAAEYYFGRPLDTFNVVDDADKAALLAGIAKSPRDYAPNAKDSQRVLRRRNQTLALMAANGFISRDTTETAKRRPLHVAAPQKDKMPQASAVLGNVLQEIRGRGGDVGVEDLLRGQIQVYTTVDARVQKIANAALESGLELYEKRHPDAKGIIQGAVVVLRNRDAGILAETGGRRFYQNRSASYSDFNRVTKSLRQPGSTMKPFVYLAAFRQGNFSLETLVPDEPISIPDGVERGPKWISNYDEQFRGMIPLREALAESRNAVAIWVTGQIGIANVMRTSRSLGVRTRLQPYLTTALGASEVNLLELANAYRAMASGIFAQPYVIRKIVRDPGETALDEEHQASRVDVAAAALSLIQEGLHGVVRIPSGTAHALDPGVFPIAVMGKTGTTNEFRDALFVGSTYGPEGITVAVRIGFDDNRSLGPNETGGRVALPVFRELMLKVYAERLVGAVPKFPAEIDQSIDDYLAGDPVTKGESLNAMRLSNPAMPVSLSSSDRGEASQRRP